MNKDRKYKFRIIKSNPLAHKICVPTLIIAGKNDEIVDIQDIE